MSEPTEKGWGLSHGAITVVNAIATGHGAALGIDLATLAQVELGPRGRSAKKHKITADIQGEAKGDPLLVQACVERTLDTIGMKSPMEVHITTTSTIPPERGLKSSSSAANAVVLATLAATGTPVGDTPKDEGLSHEDAIRIGVQAALTAGVTITGAFDDAAACYFGGLVATDNPDRRIVHREDVGDLETILVIPAAKVRTVDTATVPTHPLKSYIEEAYQLVLDGKWQQAMLRNSLAYGAAYDQSNRLVLSMLDTGAIAAGISGTGPAQAIVIRRDDWDCFTPIIATLAPDSRVLVAHTNATMARWGAHEPPTLQDPQSVQEGASDPPKVQATDKGGSR